jgi:phosphomannomutase
MSIYKAYDIRGTYPDQIEEKTARRIGMALVQYLGAKRLVVARDMRTMAPSVSDAVIDGITRMGCDVVDAGLASTPAFYAAVGNVTCDGGVVVTASHNPKQYIGLKMVKAGPVPLSGDEGIPQIQELAEGPEPEGAAEKGRREPYSVKDTYINELVDLVGGPDAIPPQKIVVDYANGMGIVEAPDCFARFPNVEVVPLYDELDGTFPNHEANPLKEENLDDLRAKMKECGAKIGLSFDGDADRCAFVDEAGRSVGADLITAILARHFLEKHPGKGIIYDLRSSRIVAETVEKLGGRPVRERVGHSFMKKTMKEQDCIGGGELSGHFYFSEFHGSDCGLLAGLLVLAELGKESKTLKQAADELRIYYQSGEVNFKVEDKAGKMQEVWDHFADGEKDRLDGIYISYPDWWVNVRPSNTEPYLRMVLEANSPELLEEKKAEVMAMLGTPA